MFIKVISHKGFWKSVVVLSLIYIVILAFLQFLMKGFSSESFTGQNSLLFILVLVVAGFIAGFMVSYGKFWGKIKRDEYRR